MIPPERQLGPKKGDFEVHAGPLMVYESPRNTFFIVDLESEIGPRCLGDFKGSYYVHVGHKYYKAPDLTRIGNRTFKGHPTPTYIRPGTPEFYDVLTDDFAHNWKQWGLAHLGMEYHDRVVWRQLGPDERMMPWHTHSTRENR
jgi:hypothetical protein